MQETARDAFSTGSFVRLANNSPKKVVNPTGLSRKVTEPIREDNALYPISFPVNILKGLGNLLISSPFFM
jgi:hypothetical protein